MVEFVTSQTNAILYFIIDILGGSRAQDQRVISNLDIAVTIGHYGTHIWDLRLLDLASNDFLIVSLNPNDLTYSDRRVTEYIAYSYRSL